MKSNPNKKRGSLNGDPQEDKMKVSEQIDHLKGQVKIWKHHNHPEDQQSIIDYEIKIKKLEDLQAEIVKSVQFFIDMDLKQIGKLSYGTKRILKAQGIEYSTLKGK